MYLIGKILISVYPRSPANETGEIVLPNRDEEDIPIVSFPYFSFYDLMGVVGK